MSDNVIPISGLPKKRKWYHRRALLLTLIVLAVVLLLGLYLLLSHADWDSFRRFFSYYSLSDKEGFGSFTFDAGYANAYCAFDDGLAVAGSGGLTTYSPYGNEQAVAQLTMDTPAVKKGGGIALAYDVGGSALLAINDKNEVVLSLSTANTLFDADIGASGSLCYLTSDKASRAILTVLNGRQEEIYKWYSNSQHLCCCAISDNARYVAAIGIGQRNGGFVSNALVLDTGKEEPVCTVDLSGQVIYSLRFLDDQTLCAVGEGSVFVFGVDGVLRGEYAYGERYMEDFCGSGSFTALRMNANRAGDKCTLVTLDADGDVLAEYFVGKQILDMDAAGDYLAVLTAGGLTIFTKELEVYRTADAVGTASSVLMRSDGTAILVSNGTAELYIP